MNAAIVLAAKAAWPERPKMSKLITHAVASGLTVANTDPYVAYLVAHERERQAHPLTRRVPGSASRQKIAAIERAAAAPQRPR